MTDAFYHCLNAFTDAFNADTLLYYPRLLDELETHPIAWITVGKNIPVALTNIRLSRSVGISWTVIDAGEAFHGDWGGLKDNHIIGYVSKSGNTEEVLRAAQYLKDQGRTNKAFAITSNKDAKILLYTTVQNVIIPIEDEGSPWNHAPFVSTPLYLLVMNSLLAETMVRTGVTKEEYFFNHPGGTIGRDLKEELE